MAKNKVICYKHCDNCGKEFAVCHKNRLKQKYICCSVKCSCELKKKLNINKEGFLNCICPICLKLFHIKDSLKNKYLTHYCSRVCQSKAKSLYMMGSGNHQFGLKGKLNSSWKYDELINDCGYKQIRCIEHPFRDSDDFVLEHRLIAEKNLLTGENSVIINDKSYLKPELVVHHKDGNKLNNSPDNLQVMTLSEHTKLHHKIRKLNKN